MCIFPVSQPHILCYETNPTRFWPYCRLCMVYHIQLYVVLVSALKEHQLLMFFLNIFFSYFLPLSTFIKYECGDSGTSPQTYINNDVYIVISFTIYNWIIRISTTVVTLDIYCKIYVVNIISIILIFEIF